MIYTDSSDIWMCSQIGQANNDGEQAVQLGLQGGRTIRYEKNVNVKWDLLWQYECQPPHRLK